MATKRVSSGVFGKTDRNARVASTALSGWTGFATAIGLNWVSAEISYPGVPALTLRGRGSAQGPWEKFKFIGTGVTDEYAIKSGANGKFVSVATGTGVLRANVDGAISPQKLASNARFLVTATRFGWTFRSRSNRKLVSAEMGSTGAGYAVLRARADQQGPWESFVPKGGSKKAFPVYGDVHFSDTFGAPRSGGRKHAGTDIMAPIGRLVVAIEAGKIVESGDGGALSGQRIWLEGTQWSYFYAHLSQCLAAKNQVVERGQPIGLVGDTGNAKGTPHLHFQINTAKTREADYGDPGVINPYPQLVQWQRY